MRFGASDIEPIVAEIGAQAKVLQIIHAALVVGVLVFWFFGNFSGKALAVNLAFRRRIEFEFGSW
jgi:hypothetical protein